MNTQNSTKDILIKKIQDRSALVAVVGMGYVGLPFAVEKAKVGFSVIGIDRNKGRVSDINLGKNYILDVKDEELASLVASKKITATTDYSVLEEADVVIICVPTPLTKQLNPDLQYVVQTTEMIAKYLKKGQMISLESTTYPGTTEEIMLPLLRKSGLKEDEDFFLGHSPERVDPGNERYTTKNTNKVVGGIGPHSNQVCLHFYSQTIEKVVAVSNAKTAELVKVFENTFRAVNIALVNELALLCDRIDINVWEVLDAAFTKPFGIMPFYPGPGVGGHCIPLDPHYLEWKAREYNFNTHFIALAGEINRSMPEFVVRKASKILNQVSKSIRGAKILGIGVAYKKNLGDHRESPAIDILRTLKEMGAEISYHDTYVPVVKEPGFIMEGKPLGRELLETQDLVLILTDHANIDFKEVVAHSKLIFDTRNATKSVAQGREKIFLL